ncbi:hypothetical protein D3C76_1563290 [compost metagenome]
MFSYRLYHFCKRLFRRVVPQAEIVGGDASFGGDRRGLDNQQACAGQCQMTEMHRVPFGGLAVIGGVLAHRCDNYTVGQTQFPQRNRGK